MSSAATTTSVSVAPRVTIAHKLLQDLQAAPAVFAALESAIVSGAAFTGPLANLQTFRSDLETAYTVFIQIAAFLKAMQAAPATPAA